MDEISTDTLTTRQRALLTKVRDAIRKTPKSYNQMSHGTGTITYRTPACVAGHIVADNAELSEQLGGRGLGEGSEAKQIGAAIREIAAIALGAAAHPALFRV